MRHPRHAGALRPGDQEALHLRSHEQAGGHAHAQHRHGADAVHDARRAHDGRGAAPTPSPPPQRGRGPQHEVPHQVEEGEHHHQQRGEVHKEEQLRPRALHRHEHADRRRGRQEAHQRPAGAELPLPSARPVSREFSGHHQAGAEVIDQEGQPGEQHRPEDHRQPRPQIPGGYPRVHARQAQAACPRKSHHRPGKRCRPEQGQPHLCRHPPQAFPPGVAQGEEQHVLPLPALAALRHRDDPEDHGGNAHSENVGRGRQREGSHLRDLPRSPAPGSVAHAGGHEVLPDLPRHLTGHHVGQGLATRSQPLRPDGARHPAIPGVQSLLGGHLPQGGRKHRLPRGGPLLHAGRQGSVLHQGPQIHHGGIQRGAHHRVMHLAVQEGGRLPLGGGDRGAGGVAPLDAGIRGVHRTQPGAGKLEDRDGEEKHHQGEPGRAGAAPQPSKPLPDAPRESPHRPHPLGTGKPRERRTRPRVPGHRHRFLHHQLLPPAGLLMRTQTRSAP